MVEITNEQADSLAHMVKMGRFMTAKDDPDMLNLIAAGLARGPYTRDWLHPDNAFFVATDDGRTFVADMTELHGNQDGGE